MGILAKLHVHALPATTGKIISAEIDRFAERIGQQPLTHLDCLPAGLLQTV
jgi:hypothetical protein